MESDAGPFPDPCDPESDLWLSTIREAAERVLGESGGSWLHYRQVAERAFARGYRSHRLSISRRTIDKSFFDTMRRTPELERSGPLFRVPIP